YRKKETGESGLAKLHIQQLLGITAEKFSFVGRTEAELLDRGYCRCDRAQRSVGRENHLIGAEELQATARCSNAPAEHRRVGIKVVHVIHVRSFQRRKNF